MSVSQSPLRIRTHRKMRAIKRDCINLLTYIEHIGSEEVNPANGGHVSYDLKIMELVRALRYSLQRDSVLRNSARVKSMVEAIKQASEALVIQVNDNAVWKVVDEMINGLLNLCTALHSYLSSEITHQAVSNFYSNENQQVVEGGLELIPVLVDKRRWMYLTNAVTNYLRGKLTGDELGELVAKYIVDNVDTRQTGEDIRGRITELVDALVSYTRVVREIGLSQQSRLVDREERKMGSLLEYLPLVRDVFYARSVGLRDKLFLDPTPVRFLFFD